MKKLAEMFPSLFGVHPSVTLNGLDEQTKDMCNVYGAAAQNAPANLPQEEHIAQVLREYDRFSHLQLQHRPAEIIETVHGLGRPVCAFLVEKGGIPEAVPTGNRTYQLSSGRFNDADGQDILKLQAYAGAVRFHDDKKVLDARQIAEFMRQDQDLRTFGDRIDQLAEETRALVLDHYCKDQPSHEVIGSLLWRFPDPDQDDSEPGVL